MAFRSNIERKLQYLAEMAANPILGPRREERWLKRAFPVKTGTSGRNEQKRAAG